MKKTYVKTGGSIRVRDRSAVTSYDELPAQTYTIKFDERAGEFFLDQIDDFQLPSKIYGKNTNHAQRILNTFNKRPGSTGVLLSGIKGAGKTLLAKQTAILAREQGIPTIVINKDWHGDEFNAFIQGISTPAIIMFDEFEKIYDWSGQRKVLTLFDGVFNSRKLFMITTNSEREISEFMINRPGRIFYNFTFDTLGQAFIQEFLEDRLLDQTQVEGFLKYTGIFSFFNFDMLDAAVEEMNRYNESLPQVLEVLNIKPENKLNDTYNIDLVFGNETISLERNYSGFQPNTFEYVLWLDEDMPDGLKGKEEILNLLTSLGKSSSSINIPVGSSFNSGVCTSSSSDEKSVEFGPGSMIRFDQVNHVFVYGIVHNGQTVELHVTRNMATVPWKFNPDAF